jgi:long-chain acyl-CoA synthetase
VQTGAEVNPYEHLEHNAQKNPDGIFLESGPTRLLNSEALTYVRKIAYELRRAGVASGSLVALDLPTGLGLLFTEALFHEALVSCVLPRRYAGRSTYPVDWVISTNATNRDSAPNFLLVDAAFLRQLELNPVGIHPRYYASATEICRLVFTSGTTGKPKAVALSFEMIEFRSQTARSVWMRDERFMSLLDAGTVSGFFTFYASVVAGAPYLAPGTMAENIEVLRTRSIGSIKASPTQVSELVRQLEATNSRLPDLKSAQIAGSVLPPQLARRLRDRTGCDIFNMYGSTEVGTVVARYKDSDDPFDAGYPTAGSSVEIVDDQGVPVPKGVQGRVRCQRPLMAEEYFRDPESSAANFRDGWFYPGDYGILQADGALTLRGRQSEFINAGGVKLDPVELDLFAVTLPMVSDACAFGYRDPSGLQQIGLALVTLENADSAQILAELSRAFGPAAPRFMVRLDEIPRNPMGKPLRAMLGQQYGTPDEATSA